MEALTDRQAQVALFIGVYGAANGYPPTRKEIAEHFGFSSENAAGDHLRALEKKGVISIKRGSARAITVFPEVLNRYVSGLVRSR